MARNMNTIMQDSFLEDLFETRNGSDVTFKDRISDTASRIRAKASYRIGIRREDFAEMRSRVTKGRGIYSRYNIGYLIAERMVGILEPYVNNNKNMLSRSALLTPISDYLDYSLGDKNLDSSLVNNIATDKVAFDEYLHDKHLAAWNKIPGIFMSDENDGKHGLVPKLSIRGSMDNLLRRGVRVSDVRNFPYGELLSISQALDSFSKTPPMGRPGSYPNRPKIAYYDDNWADSQYWDFLYIMLHKNKDGFDFDHFVETKGEGENKSYGARKNKEIGEEYAAWTQDINFAARSLENWYNVLTDKNFKRILIDAGNGSYEELKENFLKSWNWIGDNLRNLWD